MQSLVHAGKSIADGIGSVYALFDILVDTLGLTKAALLIESGFDHTFRPWSSCGFDETTLSKCRLSAAAFPHVEGTYLLDSPRNLPVSHLFSGKDYASMDLLFMMPIRAGRAIAGLLIISDNPYLTMGQTERDMIFRPLQDLFRQAISVHNEVVKLPSELEPILLGELKTNSNLKIELVEDRRNGVLVQFSHGTAASWISQEYRSLTIEAALLDVRARLVSNLRAYLRHCFSTAEFDYLWLNADGVGSIEELLDLSAKDLSANLVYNGTLEAQFRACLSALPVDTFIRAQLGASAA